jgi:hypothetical protein
MLLHAEVGLDLDRDTVLDDDVEEIGAGDALVAVGRDLPHCRSQKVGTFLIVVAKR